MTKETKGSFPHAASAKPIWHGYRLFVSGFHRTRPDQTLCSRRQRRQGTQRQVLRTVLKSGPSAVRTPRICELLHIFGLVLSALRVS